MKSDMNRVFILILTLLTMAVYLNSLSNGFVLDDDDLIVHNPVIKSWKLLPLAFKTGLYEYSDVDKQDIAYNKMYRPMQTITYFLDYLFWGKRPFGFRLTNIFIHILNAFLIYIIFSYLFNQQAAKISSLLFAIHPIQVSAVAYISGRADLLATLFMLLSIFFCLNFNKKISILPYLLSLLAATVALFCRESAIFLPLFIWLILFISGQRQKAFLLVVPFLLLDVLYIILRFIIFGYHGLASHPVFISLPIRAANFLDILVRYILILLAPKDLQIVRTTELIYKIWELKLLIAIVSILLWVYFLFRLIKKRPALFGLGWFLAGLVAVFFALDSYPFSMQVMMAESWLYISSAGFFLCIALVINRFKKLGKPVFALIAICYSTITVMNNYHWKDNIVVYTNIMKHLPERNPLHKNLARKYLEARRYNEALSEIRIFAYYSPESSERYLLEGEYYFSAGDIPKAIDSYNSVITISKYHSKAYYGLSLCYDRLNDQEKALDYAYKAVEINPYFVEAIIWLGDLYYKGKLFQKAKHYYQLALSVDPSNKITQEKIKKYE